MHVIVIIDYFYLRVVSLFTLDLLFVLYTCQLENVEYSKK